MNLLLLVLTITTTGLSAGLFFTWSFSITTGLSSLSDSNYIATMQSINRSIQNPAFFSCFFGAAILLPVSVFIYYGNPVSARFWLLLSATFIYLMGVIGVTIFGNIPLNERLDAFDLKSSSLKEISAQRVRFEAPWNRLNNIRTAASVLVFVLIVIAFCLKMIAETQ